MHNLKFLLSPRTIAFVGATTRPNSVGLGIFNNLSLTGFKGKIFPVNPKIKKIGDLLCYSSLSAIKEKIDLVVIAVPAASVSEILIEAGRLKIKAAVVISAGFKEVGNVNLENKLKQIARQYKIALLGPNCLGFINPSRHLNTTFAPMMPSAGGLAFLSQSGALGTAILDKAEKLSFGFSLFASLGNRAVLNESDFLQYLKIDNKTKVVALYAEQLSDPLVLSSVARRLNNGRKARPLLILKSGVNMLGANASASHTGAIAGNDAVYDAFFKDNNIIRAQNMSELFDYLEIFYRNPLAPARRLAIITNAGGPGVLAADAAFKNNLLLDCLDDETKSNLKIFLPKAASVANPIDILGDADSDRYLKSLKIVAADKSVQAILILLTPQSTTDIESLASSLIKWRRRDKHPLAVCLMGGDAVEAAVVSLRSAGIAVFDYPESALRSLSVLADFVDKNLEKIEKNTLNIIARPLNKKAASIIYSLKEKGIKFIPEFQVLPILQAYNLPVPKFLILKNLEEAIRAEKFYNQPVALKIASYDIFHKSEVNGVMLSVPSEKISLYYKKLLRQVKLKVPKAKIEGVLLTPMAPLSLAEIIVGSVKDESLGLALMIGWGGIYTEIIKDAAFASLPLDRNKIRRMLSELKISHILKGGRGKSGVDSAVLDKLLFSVENLLLDFPEISSLDLNPVSFVDGSFSILDARITLS